MKALVLHNINDIRYEDVDIPRIKENEVLVKVKAVGICGSDIPRVYKTGAYHYPLIVGHEFSGEVAEAGSIENNSWLNKHVGIFPLIPCDKCEPCKNEKYELCRNYDYIGSRRNGGFAEYVAVPVSNLLELPENVSFEEAAMLEPMCVAVHAIRRVSIKQTDTVAVCGLGTIGMFILMFLRDIGIENVYAIGNKDIQRENALSFEISVDNFCDSRKCDIAEFIKEKTNGRGTDIFFECIGKSEIYNIAVNNTSVCGKICLVGNPYSDMTLERQTYWKILRNQLIITGTWNSSFIHKDNDDWHYVVNRLKNKTIGPSRIITHRYEFEEVIGGFQLMRDKMEDYIKVMGILQ